MRTTYLLVDLGTILIPFIFSFHPKLRFDRTWRAFWPACIATSIFFISWDVVYTERGVWGFDPEQVTGIYLLNLPLEEVLFFICIPYACVFTYHCFGLLLKRTISAKLEHLISYFLISICILTAVINYERAYTALTFLSLSAILIYLKFFKNVHWLNRFYFTYLILLIPFFIVNGILTGSGLEKPIVWYNNSENIDIRIATIPVEDIFYGMLLILMNISFYELFKRHQHEKTQAACLPV